MKNDDIQRKLLEYSTLQNQINPHFLYNTLEAIRSQALISGQTEIATTLEKLSRFFRYCINVKGSFVTIRDEIDNVKDYLFIQNYRFDDKFLFHIQLENDDILDCYIPKMTFQPIVENAIYYGLEQNKNGGTLSIRIMSTDRKLFIIISDNGVGIPEEKLDEINSYLAGTHYEKQLHSTTHKGGNGVALANVNGRIKLFFGEEYGVRILSVLNVGTDVEIVLPYVDEMSLNDYL